MSEGKNSQLPDIEEVDDKMDAEDQFCLQWNDHKSTLVTVFESLLESGTLVDCSLAAEGQYLKAHKVVLSACSPYFELLFSEHKEKHPILILKDVKFQELKALMDYMYRGEVNIPQDRLRALLETAESLQIKGLGGCKAGNESPMSRTNSDDVQTTSSSAIRTRPSEVTSDSTQMRRGASPLLSNIRKGSVSPTPRKRSRNHLHTSASDDTSSRSQTSESFEKRSEITSQTCPPPPALPQVDITPVSSISSSVPSALSAGGSTTISSIRREWASRAAEGSSSPMQGNVLFRGDMSSSSHSDLKPETSVEILLTPKTEYVEDVGDEDTTENSIVLDDAEYMTEPKSGPSHAEDGSSNQGPGFAPWLSVAEWAADEVLPPQAVGAFRDPPGGVVPRPSIGNAMYLGDRQASAYAAAERKKKRCAFCPRLRDRKTTVYCASCLRPMCTAHRLSFDICRDCGTKKLGLRTLSELDVNYPNC